MAGLSFTARHSSLVTVLKMREKLMTENKGFTLWLTGLSGAGKTTLTERIVPELRARGVSLEVLDGDEVRTNLSKGLGFSKEDRDTNIRRIGYVSRLLARNGVGVVTAAISPYREVRDEVRRSIEADGAEFVEVYVKCPIEVLAERDVKGLYKKALAGEIKEFTGVSDPYEEPLKPEITVETAYESVELSASRIVRELELRGLIPVAIAGEFGYEGELEGKPYLTALADMA
ncbi:MAG TPA: adenylyl-sulfate kinase [Pyrinomonadaceae bacterium]|jgi:adenylyl-sulfate kinase